MPASVGVPASAAMDPVPTIVSAMPMSTVRRNPMRRYRRPDSDAEIGQPIVSAASARPETSGVTRSDPSR